VPYPSRPIPPALISLCPQTRTHAGVSGFPGTRCAAALLSNHHLLFFSFSTQCAVFPLAAECEHFVPDGRDYELRTAAGDAEKKNRFYSCSAMRFEAELGIRRLVLTVSTFVFLIGLPIIYGLQFLPPDHVQLRSTLTAYFIFLLVVSFVGIIAAVTVRSMRRRRTRLLIFSREMRH
jgi:hypothetical protein